MDHKTDKFKLFFINKTKIKCNGILITLTHIDTEKYKVRKKNRKILYRYKKHEKIKIGKDQIKFGQNYI